MSSQAVAAPSDTIAAVRPWALWRSQVRTILGMELRKNFLTKRGIWIYLLALAPVALVWAHSFHELWRGVSRHPLAADTNVLSGIFHLFYLRLGIFFGCVGIFTYLFRGEVLERSLHYYFLAPVRREVLLVAKYLAGLITASFFFTASIVLAFGGIYWHHTNASIQTFLFEGPGLQHLLGYAGVTLLACVGYGAVFLAMGLIYKNPMIAAGQVFIWEAGNLFLPAILQKLSVIFYLKNLAPVAMPTGRRPNPADVLAMVVDPVPAYLAIPGLILFSLSMLAFAALKLRKAEISYSAD